MRSVICSICSREKSTDMHLVPAGERYRGSHVSRVAGYALEQELPFYILSGVYGFISAQVLLPPYDHLLVDDEAPLLSQKVSDQLRPLGIQEIHFYTKSKPSWQPYRDALARATSYLGITLHVHELSEND